MTLAISLKKLKNPIWPHRAKIRPIRLSKGLKPRSPLTKPGRKKKRIGEGSNLRKILGRTAFHLPPYPGAMLPRLQVVQKKKKAQDVSKITCYNYNKKGHYFKDYIEPKAKN